MGKGVYSMYNISERKKTGFYDLDMSKIKEPNKVQAKHRISHAISSDLSKRMVKCVDELAYTVVKGIIKG